MTMKYCPQCTQKAPLYRCPKCGLTGHVDVEGKTVTIHPPAIDTKLLKKGKQVTMCYPNHFDCEFAKPVNQIDTSKLEKVS